MRPRHHTAENPKKRTHRRGERCASMRPRHHTAENASTRRTHLCCGRCFNEAAASHRGKRRFSRMFKHMPPASMRPRHHTAENLRPGLFPEETAEASMRPRHHTAENSASCGCTTWMLSFNEAAASHRGKPGPAAPAQQHRGGFNEAAASHRGKRWVWHKDSLDEEELQ